MTTVVIKRKWLGVAVAVEVVIVLLSLFVAVTFAYRYADTHDGSALFLGHPVTFWLAISGGLMLCAAETARLPLVLAARCHNSLTLRIMATLGVCAMVLVTTKSVAVISEQAYRPRLHEVIVSKAEYASATAQANAASSAATGADVQADPLSGDVERIDAQLVAAQTSLQAMGPQPRPVCSVTWHRDKKGKRYKSQRCTQPAWPGNTLLKQIDTLNTARTEAATKRSRALAVQADKDSLAATAQQSVAETEAKMRDAIQGSQLHNFAAMLWAIDPKDVTEAQLAGFLRWFILMPAFLIAAASSSLAAVSVTRIPAPKPDGIAITDPVVNEIINQVISGTKAVPPKPNKVWSRQL